ncbi:other/FunK1 protein kinase, variant 2 [Coprinopsis cinerea AmutBmut pab1-1]|nr:other/FunK1 protein kinase, variant 2 [Coprinopsis cinerea AmutBmut pab1-1]
MVQQAGVLHGNVSINSIIFGGVVPGADSEEGRRVSLVDFDIVPTSFDRSDALSDELRTGTRMFQSLNALKTWRPHDYLDDLESFLYVLAYLVFAFPSPGASVTVKRKLPMDLQDWNARDLRRAFNSKSEFIDYGPQGSDLPVPPMWGPHIFTLIDDLCLHFQPIHTTSSRMRSRSLSTTHRENIEISFKEKYLDNRVVDGRYDEVVGYFESAIKSILAEQDSANDSEQSTLSDSLSHSRPSKGRREEGI